MDHTQHQMNAVEDSGTLTSQSDERLYVIAASCFTWPFMLLSIINNATYFHCHHRHRIILWQLLARHDQSLVLC